MHENIRQWDPWSGYYWWHRWMNGSASKVPVYTSKFKVWRPTRRRARDGAIVRHKTGGLRRVA